VGGGFLGKYQADLEGFEHELVRLQVEKGERRSTHIKYRKYFWIFGFFLQGRIIVGRKR
jgi:hypothetical protein